ncbi:MAG TPA: FIST N-terminal domain-containing protein [Mycobacteriales bacterium]|nr:FIST N-terminal domain-containing protein [Mycobacteriales bacterium]
MSAPMPAGPRARFGDGLATGLDLGAVALDASSAALSALDGRAPDLVVVFVATDDPDAAEAALTEVAREVKARHLVGASVHGAIAARRGIEDHAAVAVWAGSLPGARLRAFHLEVLPGPDGLRALGLPPGDDAYRAGLLIADPWSFPADAFVEGSANVLPGVPLVGGMAAGRQGAGSTRLMLDGRLVDRGAVGVLVGGDVHVGALVSQGCRPVGPPMIVTAALGKNLLGLAGSSAVDRLERLMTELAPHDQALASGGLLLGVALDEYAESHELGDFLVRPVLGVDRGSGGLVTAESVEVGRTVRFHVRDAASADAELRRRLAQGPPHRGGVLLSTCIARGRHLFPPALGGSDHDVQLVHELLHEPAVAGFFADGEIGPAAGRNHLHTHSASMLVFGPGDASDGQEVRA